MSSDDPDTAVQLANTRYLQAKEQADAAAEDLFDAYAAAAQAGRTPDELAEGTAFTASYIRRKVRERGVAPRKGGPKPRDSKMDEA